MGKPAGQLRLESGGQLLPDIQEGIPRPPAEPLQTAADVKVDIQLSDVDRNDAGRVVAVDHGQGPCVPGPGCDAGNVLNISRFKVDVGCGDKHCSLIDPLQYRGGIDTTLISARHHVQLPAHEASDAGDSIKRGREILVCGDDFVFLLVSFEELGRERHPMSDRSVGYHRHLILACADDTGHSITDFPGQVPPLFTPGCNSFLGPEPVEPLQVFLSSPRNSAQ